MKTAVFKNIQVSAGIAAQVLLCLLFLLRPADIVLFLALSAWIWFMVYALESPSERAEILVFLAMFYLFILGGQVALNFMGYVYESQFSQEIEHRTNIVILLSLAALSAGFFFPDLGKKVLKGREKESSPEKKKRRFLPGQKDMEELRLICQRLSLVFFYVTTVPAVMVTLERGMQARAAGYHEAYTYVSSFPGIVNRMANAQAVFFYVFLASMPEKKKGLLPIAVYLVYSALTLLTGRRIYFTAALLMIFFYFLIRSASQEKKWITRRHLIGAAVLVPFLILLLQAVFVMRENKTGEIDGIFGTLKHFLGRQGYTVILIKYVQEFAEKLGRGKFYSFYNTIRFFRTNVITRHFVPQDYGFEYGTYTVENATLGNSLANSVTYLKYPNYFLRGGGTGSCYAAELFLDFGYIGVLAGNFVYGLFFRLLRFMRKKGTVLTTIALIFMNDMIRTPRYNFDQIMEEARYPSEWILLLLLAALAWGIWKLRRHREKNPDI